MLNRTFFLLAATCATLCSAAPTSTQTPSQSNTGGITGMEISTLYGDVESYLTGGYVNDFMTVSLGVNFERFQGHEKNVGGFLGHLGLRTSIARNLYFTFGGMAQGEACRKDPSRNWSVGAFAGLDAHLTNHLLLSGKIYPYNYENHYSGRSEQCAFTNGNISLLYLF